MIKPDGVRKHIIGAILSRFERVNLRVVGLKMVRLTQGQAERFYAIHKGKPFFPQLIGFITSGPIVVATLEGEGAIEKNRQLMGETDPQKANPGTIRHDFAQTIEANIVHGSDSRENAEVEVGFFFSSEELFTI